MNAFDSIIGYAKVKRELEQIADTLKHSWAYLEFGVTPPKGLLLYGEPGVGKSLMASCLIKASEREAFICRKDEPSGEFVKKIKQTFDSAAKATPSIVYLDDMDKFASEDASRSDAEEYVAVQACIDELKGADVFVLATANNIHKLPRSLLRAGRIDRRMEIEEPRGEDAEQIIAHYLSKKEFVGEIDCKTVARIMDGRSCAALETLINEAGVRAGYLRKKTIDMDDIVQTALRTVFGTDGFDEVEGDSSPCVTEQEIEVACHEAGHTVISELLDPGSTTLVSIQPRNGNPFGLTSRALNSTLDPIKNLENEVAIALGGAAAVECDYGFHGAGSGSDFGKAYSLVKHLIEDEALCGFGLLEPRGDCSPALSGRIENTVAVELEKYYRIAKGLILQNKEFHASVAQELLAKKVLLASDLAEIRESLGATKAAA